MPQVSVFSRRVFRQWGELEKALCALDSSVSRRQIHDLRVLTRRLGASLEVLRTLSPKKKVLKKVKVVTALTRLLGPVRSTDVAHSDLKSRLFQMDPQKNSLSAILPWFKRKRVKLRKKWVKKMKGKGIAGRIEGKGEFGFLSRIPAADLMTSLKHVAQKQRLRLLKSWKIFEKSGKIKEMHALRIDLKKWRYLAEIEAEILREPSEDFFAAVKEVQEHLGHIHDAEALSEFLESPSLRALAKKKHLRKELKKMKGLLKDQMRHGLVSFHREGEKVLLPLLQERS